MGDARLPDAALVHSASRALLVVAAALYAAAWALGTLVFPGDALLLKTAGASLAGLMVLRALPAHRPHARFGAANTVTLVRAALVALLAGLIGAGGVNEVTLTAMALGIPAVALDGADGWLARRTGMASDFGARFDMETDAALTLVLCVLAWQVGKAGPWILAAGLLRYAFIAAAWALPWMRAPLPPAWRRKAACVTQLVVLLAMLTPFVPRAASAALGAAALALLAWSFAIDVHWLARERKS